MRRLVLPSILLPLLLPPAVFVLVALSAGLSLAEALSAAGAQYSAQRLNLLVLGLFGLFPVALLWLGLWIHRRAGGAERVRRTMFWGGLLSVSLVLIWVNFEFWPLFLPDRSYPGFPHGLEFVIGPGLFAPVAMLLGMAAGWIVSRR